MAEERVQTGISISESAMEHLREMAQRDSRTVSGEIESLVNKEWERRIADMPTAQPVNRRKQ